MRSLKQRFFSLALVNILSNVTVPLVGLVDTAMLGHLPDIRFLAGVALGSILFDYVYWTFGFLRMGTTGTTAQALGRGEDDEVFRVLYRSLVLALAIAGAVLALQWPIRELGFSLLSGETGVEAAGRDYFNARIWGAPATLCTFVMVGWFLGREESRRVLLLTIVGNVANIALNYVFIIRLQMAARGAGLATMVSQYLMFAVALMLFLRMRRSTPWHRREVLDRGKLSELFRLNRDILIRTLCLVSTFAAFVNFSSVVGTTILAANSILLRLLSVASYLIDGAAFASESLAGIFLGRKDLAALRRVFRMALVTGFGFAVLFLAVVFVSPRGVTGLLTSHEVVIAETVRYAWWLIPTLLFGSLAYMYDGLFLGLTEGRTLRNSMLACTLLVFLPIAMIAAHRGSNDLLWLSMAVFMAARTATLGIAGRRMLTRLEATGFSPHR